MFYFFRYPIITSLLEGCVQIQKVLAGSSHWYQDCPTNCHPYGLRYFASPKIVGGNH